MMGQRIAIGRVVRVRGLPPGLEKMPAETQAAFRAALGRVFTVAGHGRCGHIELVLGPELDAVVGGTMNVIWIEPELVEAVET